jgi:hypothetical protein
MTLSPAATIVLARAAERPDRLLQFHRKLPTAARHKMITALLRDGIIKETNGDFRLGDGSTLIEDGSTGLMLTTLAVTDDGFRAINLDPPAATPQAAATDAPTALPTKTSLRDAAQAVLDAWDNEGDGKTGIIAALEDPIAALRRMLARPAPRGATAPRKLREGTKQEAVLNLLCRPEGATIAQIVAITGWASHTVRGFFAGLKKKGFTVETLERVRQVGTRNKGAKGSYSIYHIPTAA